MSTTEEGLQEKTTVTPSATTPKDTGRGAFAAARASLHASGVKQDTHVVLEPPSKEEQPPVEAAEKVEAQPQETTEESEHLFTPEYVASLPAELQTRYKQMNGDYTRKTQALAKERKDIENRVKELDEWQSVIEGLKKNTDETIEQLAKHRGLTISRNTEQATSEETPEELKPLESYLEARDKRLESRIRAEYEPVKAKVAEMETNHAAAETKATVEAFTSKYPGWEKYESAMMDVGKKFVPTAGAMTDFEYMEHLYTIARSKDSEAEKTKKVISKINNAAKSVEPNRSSGVSSEQVEHVLPPPEKRGIRESYAAAKRGEAWTK